MFGYYPFESLQSLLADLYAGRRIDVRPFGYTFDFAAVADGTIAITSQKIIGNADFFVCSASFAVRLSTENVGDAVMQIEDSGSNEKFFNQATPIQQFCTTMNGAGDLAVRGLTFPRRVAANSTLTATLTGGSAITNPQLYLDGVHVYVYSN